MGWQCKICKSLSSTKGNLLKHYRLQHATFGRGQSQPCLYDSCPCTFKTLSALGTHLWWYHAAEESLQPRTSSAFKCLVCNSCYSTENFHHIGKHLINHETIFCVFEGCNFQTNIYNTFLKHKSRRHTSYSLSDFKQEVYESHHNQTVDHSDLPEACEVEGTSLDCDQASASYLVLKKIGLLLLKLEGIYNASGKCIDALVEDLHFISSSSIASVKNILDTTLKLNKCVVDQAGHNRLGRTATSTPWAQCLQKVATWFSF